MKSSIARKVVPPVVQRRFCWARWVMAMDWAVVDVMERAEVAVPFAVNVTEDGAAMQEG